MNSSQKTVCVNSILVEKDFEVSQEYRLKLQRTPLHQCKSVLKKLVGNDYNIYSGSHHISVINDKGHVVLSLKEIGYF